MRILLVEDNEKLNESIKYQLMKENFLVDSCTDGEEALYYIEQNIHDILLLDCMLPCVDGISILKKIRRENNHIPVIMITALGTLDDKLVGLNNGADDYLVKPFAFEELLARIHCIARRPRTLNPNKKLTFASIVYDLEEGTLSGPKKSCTLSKREGALLETFLRNPEQTLSRTTLLCKIWGPTTDVEEGNLDNYLYFIRRRLHAVANNITIRNIRGIGFRMEETKCE